MIHAEPISLCVVVSIVLALVFDFLNGFHDAANSIATAVSTRVLTPGFAVLRAAFFNFITVFIRGVAGRIVWAWVLTIPASAAVAALTY